MPLNDKEIGKMLLEQSYVSEEELKVSQEKATERNVSLLSILIDSGLLTSQLYEGALAEHYKLPFFDLQAEQPTADIVNLIPEDIARMYSAVVVKREGDTITVATSDPGNSLLEEAIRLNFEQEEPLFPEKEKKEGKEDNEEKPPSADEAKGDGDKEKKAKDAKESGEKKKKEGFRFPLGRKKKVEDREKFNGKIIFVFVTQSAIDYAFSRYQKPLATRFQQIIDEQDKVAPEILEEIVNDAIQLRASDIHFEPQEKIVVVRFRVDGVMHEAGRIPKEYYEGVLNRIKIDGNMRIDEHFTPQDGAVRHSTNAGPVDIRVSIIPIVDGEKVVMRLLSSYVRNLTLGDLGFSQANREILEKVVHKPFGMVLTTGPTGSGKSTTLYALIKMRNSIDVNISTIEDPVEYKIEGINHIQVNTEAKLTFASGLRALVRQDPDIILVGEIRDGETADISVNAALTGHLMFSTLHANDASTSVPRLLDMGVEPFLLASTLEVVIAQRLARRICPQCRYSYTLPPEKTKKLFPGAGKFFSDSKEVTLYKGKGCEACGDTGYRGRVGIYELMDVTPAIEELIIAQASSTEINAAAIKGGMRLMFEDGFDKVMAGMTTLEELMRVAAPPEIVYAKLNTPASSVKKEVAKSAKSGSTSLSKSDKTSKSTKKVSKEEPKASEPQQAPAQPEAPPPAEPTNTPPAEPKKSPAPAKEEPKASEPQQAPAQPEAPPPAEPKPPLSAEGSPAAATQESTPVPQERQPQQDGTKSPPSNS